MKIKWWFLIKIKITTQLELNKIDPTNLNGKKISKTTSTIKIVNETKSIPENVSYFIDGKKSK
jgi:hypothetical protein